MSDRATTLAVAGLGAGLGVAGAVTALLHRTLQPALEIERYARDIEDAARAISANLDGAAEVVHTRDLAVTVPPLVSAYAGLGREPT